MRNLITFVIFLLSFGQTLAKDVVLPDDFYLLAKNNSSVWLVSTLHEKKLSRPFVAESNTSGALSSLGYISIGFGGWSEHNTHGKPNRNNEVNPSLTLNYRPWGHEKVFLIGRPFLELGRTFKNSRHGYTNFFFLGNEWSLLQGSHLGIYLGSGIIYLKYEDGRSKPGKQKFSEGTLPLLYGSVDFLRLNTSIRVIPLGGDVLFVYVLYHF